MKKRAVPVSSPSASSPSSSSSCVVDDDDHNLNDTHNHIRNQPNNEDDNPPKPKRARRKRISINSKPEKSPKVKPNATTNRRSSIYRGVTRHRWTGRFEAHLWDKSTWNNIQNKKGRQVYLGAYDNEVDAARTYDLAALKYWGPETTLNFHIENYVKEVEEMQNVSKEEYLASLRRRSSGFSRGVSKYRGVARHHHNGRWEARIGRVFGNKYLYLGTFSSQEEAAVAYDLAAIQYRGANAVTNFDISKYIDRVKNLMPKDELQPPDCSETKCTQQKRQQRPESKIKQQKEEEQQYEQELQHACLQAIEQEEQMAMPSKFEESKLDSSIDHSSLLVVDPNDDRESPWSFCLDNGGYDPLLVPDIPFEEDGRLLDLFDQTSFEDNIDLIFEGEWKLVSMDGSYPEGIGDVGCQTEIKASTDLDKIETSLCSASSSPSSPASTTSVVTCQL